MDMVEPVTVSCPYCGESFETSVDLTAGSQQYIEDCYVCCQPIQFDIKVNDYVLESVEVTPAEG
jgi:hypothetical protein